MTAASFIDSIGWTLLHFIWQGLLIGCITALACTLLRNAHPTWRYNAAGAGLLTCLLWPAAELSLRLQGGDMVATHMRYADALFAGTAGDAPDALIETIQTHLFWIVGLWALCAALMAVRMAFGLAWVARTRSTGVSDPHWQAVVARIASNFGVSRAVRLRVTDGLASPVTAGWWRPVVVVPTSLVSGMPHELLEALIAHEMAHVRRLDYLVNLGQNVVEILLFYHPAVWWISGRMRAERELIADDLAARHTGAPQTLAKALAELERTQFAGAAMAMAANGGDLLARVRRLVRPDRQGLSWKAAIPVAGLALVCFATYTKASMAPVPPVYSELLRRPVANFNSCIKPMYPAADLAAGHQGTVTLAFLIGVDGLVKDARVDKSSGYPQLDSAAKDAIRKCSFDPAFNDKGFVRSWTKVQYVWTLR